MSTPPPGDEPHRERSQQNKGFAQSVAFSAARGALLIGVAVVIGIVLLQVIDNDTTGPIGDGGNSSGAATTTTTAAAGSGTTTTTSGANSGAVLAPSAIPVQVLNGSGVAGAAASMTQKLQSSGYQVLTPNDTSAATATTVYCTGGLDREASALAAAVGGSPPPAAQALPDPPPAGSDSSAKCIVVVGS